jgi:PAS domain S-box-containing protein
MTQAAFDQQVEAIRGRLAALSRHTGATAQQEALRLESLAALSAALEGLSAARRALCQQCEEVAAARQTVEAERQRSRCLFESTPDAYRSFFENGVEGIFQTTPEGRVRAVNPALARMLGYDSPERFIVEVNDVARQLYASPKRREDFSRLLKEQGAVQGFEVQLIRRDGSMIWATLSARAVRDESGALLYYEGTASDITARMRLEEKLHSSRQQLRALATRLESVREEERSSIVTEISRDLMPWLTGVAADLLWLTTRLPEDQPALREKVGKMIARAGAASDALRKISTELRPGILEDLGLATAIEWQAHEFQTRTGINCEFVSGPKDLLLDLDLSRALFRICQESLRNVERHARATLVTIRLTAEAGHLTLTVEDDGRGITAQERADRRSLGLLRMHERALLLGGELTIMGRAGAGTTVTVKVPLQGA